MSVVGAWFTIVRFGLAQAAIAAVTVLPITTLPRLMQNELGLLAVVAGVMIGVYYGVQVTRVMFGHASDALGRRTPFIIGGLLGLGIAGVLASLAVTLMTTDLALGYAAAAFAYAGVGLGVGAAGTNLLALLSATVHPDRRAPAATIVWLLMIFGIAGTATAAGAAMTPFSYVRLVEVAIAVSIASVLLGAVAVWGLERSAEPAQARKKGAIKEFASHAVAFREMWHEPATRAFAVFVFVAMFAFNMQEVVFETFLGATFGLDAGDSTRLSGFHRFGILAGLIVSAVLGRLLHGTPRAMVSLTVAGCVGSSLALLSLGSSVFAAAGFPLVPAIIAFGVANGVFAGGAVASMFSLAVLGRERREGTRMGAFGLAQALGFGSGMLAGALLLDVVRVAFGAPAAFASVFFTEAAIFLFAAALALRLARAPGLPAPEPLAA